ncbi:UPF0598 protein C8orf82 [Hyaloraphidium curvatum]|nr:UPF0598 protein C8orf82 [Hyaloraphidium curvatum]
MPPRHPAFAAAFPRPLRTAAPSGPGPAPVGPGRPHRSVHRAPPHASPARVRRLSSSPPSPAARPSREYFYHVDVHGQLFLHETKIKNFTSCFKDPAFLRFFFTRLRACRPGEGPGGWPWVSPCGGERNYVRSEDVPIVYTDLVERQGGKWMLLWAGTEEVPFDPSRVHVSPRGYMYHPSPSAVGTAPDRGLPPLALLRSAAALKHLGPRLGAGGLRWEGEEHPLVELDGEPGEGMGG